MESKKSKSKSVNDERSNQKKGGCGGRAGKNVDKSKSAKPNSRKSNVDVSDKVVQQQRRAKSNKPQEQMDRGKRVEPRAKKQISDNKNKNAKLKASGSKSRKR